MVQVGGDSDNFSQLGDIAWKRYCQGLDWWLDASVLYRTRLT